MWKSRVPTVLGDTAVMRIARNKKEKMATFGALFKTTVESGVLPVMALIQKPS